MDYQPTLHHQHQHQHNTQIDRGGREVGRAVQLWMWTWTLTWTRVWAEWAEEGAGVEPTDTDRWGPGASTPTLVWASLGAAT